MVKERREQYITPEHVQEFVADDLFYDDMDFAIFGKKNMIDKNMLKKNIFFDEFYEELQPYFDKFEVCVVLQVISNNNFLICRKSSADRQFKFCIHTEKTLARVFWDIIVSKRKSTCTIRYTLRICFSWTRES